MFQNSNLNNLSHIAQCHRKAFPKSFSSQLGQKYCEKMLEWYLSTDKAFLFHIEENNLCVGYTGGIINDGTLSTGSSSAMTQYSFKEGIKALLFRPWLWLHPEMRKNYRFLFRNLAMKLGMKKAKRSQTEVVKMQNEPMVGLVVIGVNPDFQGKGYGSALLQEFEKRTLDLGIKKMNLTVKAYNYQAIQSYERNGWVKSKEVQVSLNMIKEL